MLTVFLDRDGVINKKLPEGEYVTDIKKFQFLSKVAEAIRIFNKKDFRVIVVTNQRGIALGYMTEQNLANIHKHMIKQLALKNAHLDAIYYCPHNEGKCKCRKPNTGLFLKAKTDFPDIIFSESYLIGDSEKDIQAGYNIGCNTILICNTSEQFSIKPNYIASSLFEATQIIIKLSL